MNSLLHKVRRRHYNILGVGDRSGSKSEDYVLNVFQLQPDGSEKRIYTLRSGGVGQYKDETKSFPRNHSYSFQIDWQGTNNQGTSASADSEGADFDYDFIVQPLSGNESHTLIDAYDPRDKTVDTTQTLRGNRNNITDFPQTHEPKRVVLLRAGILVDANRDGQFSQADEGKITQEKPWRIWVNDDDDWHETGGSDIPDGDANKRDAANNYIDQVRDLVDFFPLTLQIQQACKLLPAEKYRYAIVNQGTALRICWVKEHELNNSYGPCDKHHKEIEYARNVSKLQTNPLTHAADGLEIPHDMLNILATGKGILLIEGSLPTNTDIKLRISKKEGNETIATTSLPMRISKVEDMYRKVNLMTCTKTYDGNSAGGQEGTISTNTAEPTQYPDSETNGKYFVFLHGFHVSPEKARGWNSEIFKRLHQMGSKARFVGITWHGSETLPNYHRAVFQAFQTGDELADALDFTNGADTTVAAHSLGNMVVSHAIQDGGFLPSRYYSFNAAVPREAYSLEGIDYAEKRRMVEREWKPYWDYNNPDNSIEPTLKHLFAANWHELFPPSDYRNTRLTWKKRFDKVAEKTDHYNFFSETDEVVRDAPVGKDSVHVLKTLFPVLLSQTDVGSYSWISQEFVKGGTSVASLVMQPSDRVQAGWKFENNYGMTVTGEEVYFERFTPLQASAITLAQLRSLPFFSLFKENDLRLSGAGSAKAAEKKVQYEVLARGIPALSFAAATHAIPGAKGNFDMHNTMRTDYNQWPVEGHTEGINIESWRHSDMRDVAFLHVYKLYQQMINTGNLNQ